MSTIYSYRSVLALAWLSLWDEHIATGRINQVISRRFLRAYHARTRGSVSFFLLPLRTQFLLLTSPKRCLRLFFFFFRNTSAFGQLFSSKKSVYPLFRTWIKKFCRQKWFLETLIFRGVAVFVSIFEYFVVRAFTVNSLPSFEAAFDLSHFGGSAET